MRVIRHQVALFLYRRLEGVEYNVRAPKMKSIILFIIVTSLGLSEAVFSCSCVGPERLDKDDFSENVFVGVVESKDFSFSLYQNKYKFNVKKTILGGVRGENVLWTDKSMASCGYPYKKDVEYLVILNTNDKKYRSGLCSSWPMNSESAKIVLSKLAENP